MKSFTAAVVALLALVPVARAQSFAPQTEKEFLDGFSRGQVVLVLDESLATPTDDGISKAAIRSTTLVGKKGGVEGSAVVWSRPKGDFKFVQEEIPNKNLFHQVDEMPSRDFSFKTLRLSREAYCGHEAVPDGKGGFRPSPIFHGRISEIYYSPSRSFFLLKIFEPSIGDDPDEEPRTRTLLFSKCAAEESDVDLPPGSWDR